MEVILSGSQARKLRNDGLDLRVKKVDGHTSSARATAAIAQGMEVFRPYSGPGGLEEEYRQAARDNPRIAKLVELGRTVQGKPIVALKVTKDPNQRDGRKPSVLYLSAQHAREWITPEMNRRLMHYFLDGYNTNRTVRKLVDTRELWFVPVANPDGYDWTFEPGQRLWRKNLRDNNNDGRIASGDGVDLNRNFAYRWGYDNEGSSPAPSSETYRGPGPNSEPETQALDRFAARLRFEFFVNYHSAAELLLYGVGWQVATPTPDDVLYEAMAGDDADPAIPGYDPDISAELYTTNGDTDSHLQRMYGTLGFTPEMATCEAASDSVPDDEWEADDCDSGFNFPDDEELVQAEFEKNIPFALSVAKSADDPDDPESAVGRRAEDFRVDTFEVSYGDPQTVAVVAKRALRGVQMRYRIDGGRTRTAGVREWQGGERYGDENDDYYAEYRGQVRGADPGDRVQVWFEARKKGRGWIESERFTYRLARDTGDDVLIIANEDYTGVNPTYPAGTDAPKYVQEHRRAIRQAGYRVRRLGRRPPRRAARPRRARSLRRRPVVPRRQPDHPGPGGRAHPRREPGVPGHRSGRAPAVPHAAGARLPQRRRQADPRRRDRAVRGSPGDQRRRRRALLRHQRRRDGRVRRHDEPLRRLPDPGERLPPVLPRGVYADRLREPRVGHRHRRSDRGLPRHVRRPGGDTRQPARRSGRIPADERGAAAGRVPAVHELGVGRVPAGGAQQPVPADRGLPVRGGAPCGRLVHAADEDRGRACRRDRLAGVPALDQHRERLRPRVRRSPHGRR